MKYLGYLILLLLGGCNTCRYVDCYSGPVLHFRVMDTDGNDLIYDLNVSVDSLSMRSTNDFRPDIEAFNPNDKVLTAYLYPGELTYEIGYKGRSTEITLTLHQTGDSKCCGPQYEIAEITSMQGKVPTLVSPVEDIVYIIQL